MPIICPTILAASEKEYKQQINRVADFAQRLQIDLADGGFAKSKTLAPEDIWWPVGVSADVHLMFDSPKEALEQIIKHKPHLVIVHAEAQVDLASLHQTLSADGIKLGLALLPQTLVENSWPLIERCSHVMIFSGQLGEFGGHADLSLLDKVKQIKERLPDIEIGWDGGINDQNVAMLVDGGVDVLNVGGFLQHSPNPARTYSALQRIADETGTT